MFIDIKKTAQYPAVKLYLSNRVPFSVIALLLILSSAASIIFLAVSVLSKSDSKNLFYLCFGLDILVAYFYLFFRTQLRNSGKVLWGRDSFDDENIADYLSFEAALPFYYAEKLAANNKVDSRTFFAYCIKTNPFYSAYVLERLGINFAITKKNFSPFFKQHPTTDDFSEDTERIMKAALERAISCGHKYIEISDVMYSFIMKSQFIKESLIRLGIHTEDVDAVIAWKELEHLRKQQEGEFWKKENLLKKPGVGVNLAFGFTPRLDQHSQNLTERVKYMKLNIVGHREEINEMGRVLARMGKNNILLVGEPGGGRKTLLYGLIRDITQGRSEPELQYKRVVLLNMGSLLSGARTSGEITQQIQTVFMEAQYAGNVIIVIDNFHHYVSSGAQEATANITPIIMPYLKSPNFQLIGICDNTGYRRYVEPNKDLFSQFEEVKVAETTAEETFLILQNVLPSYERMYGVVVTIGALREIISLSEIYMPNVAFPEKAINLLSEICVYAADSRIRHILPMMVADYIAKKVQAPVGEMKKVERDMLVNLETFLHKRVIGQEEAISVLADAMRRARTGVGRKKKPIGTFLFLGPTGVGKTETAKALAESYFGSEDRIVRFDMSEYSEPTALDILIGSEVGNNPGHLATRVKENPFSVVLFDEIEKAHRTVHDLFLQVLDEGYCTDAFGQKISFLSSIIIATSNAGAIQLRDMVKQNFDRAKIKSLIIDVVIKEGIFRPEFLNRFDATVVFDILTKENIIKITDLMFKRLGKRLEDKGYFFSYSKEVVEKLSDIGFDPVFGGRAVARAMQEKIEGKIALDILSEKYKPGDTVVVGIKDFQ